MNRPFYLKSRKPNIITKDMLEQFSNNNPKLQNYIDSHKIELRPLDISNFESFCAWIISQQISGNVAELLYQRFRTKFAPITPDKILKCSINELLDLGLSKAKAEYLKNLADFFKDGKSIMDAENYSSQDLRAHYSQIKGIGQWTVNMWLIFNLGRLDVFAVGDLAVRKGLMILYDLDKIPSIEQAKNLGASWRDLGTIGTILAWAVIGE